MKNFGRENHFFRRFSKISIFRKNRFSIRELHVFVIWMGTEIEHAISLWTFLHDLSKKKHKNKRGKMKIFGRENHFFRRFSKISIFRKNRFSIRELHVFVIWMGTEIEHAISLWTFLHDLSKKNIKTNAEK